MKDVYFKYFLIITLFLSALTVVYPFFVNSYFNDWPIAGNFGDSYGALNTLFTAIANAGILVTILIQRKELENQRHELELQRDEMTETRKEFLLNRTTTIIYSQLERFEASLKDLCIKYEGKEYIGSDAIFILDMENEYSFDEDDLSEEENLKKRKKNNYDQTKILIANKREIEQFAYNISNSVNVLKSLIFKTQLDIEELVSLKSLFFENIGFINMGVIERISNLAQEQIDIFTTDDYLEYDMEIGQLLRADMFLKPVKDFYHTKLNDDNFKVLRQKWLKERGITSEIQD